MANTPNLEKLARLQVRKQKDKKQTETNRMVMRIAGVVALGVLIAIIAAFVRDANGGSSASGASRKSERGDAPPIDHSLNLQELKEKYATITNPRVSARPNIAAKLGFVTTWNAQGKEIATGTYGKFSILSPVWFRIGPDAEMTGAQDIDSEWLDNLRAQEENVKIMPRFMFHDWDAQDLLATIDTKAGMMKIATAIIKTCKKHAFDGVVLEIFNAVASEFSSEESIPVVKEKLFKFIRSAGRAIQKGELDLVLVVPPYPELVGPEDLGALEPVVTYFQVMTYDHHPLRTMAPNAPIEWMEQVVTTMSPDPDGAMRSKILLGMNMYGTMHKYDSEESGKHIIGSDFLQFIEHKDLLCRWYEEPVAEHVCQFSDEGDTYIVFYPTEKSLIARLDLAERLGTGIATWELGQTVPSYLQHF